MTDAADLTSLAPRGVTLLGCGKMGGAMLEGWLRKDKREYDPEAIESVISATEGYSGADMKAVAKEAAFGPVREALKQPVGTPLRPITGEDFERACTIQPRSVPDSVVARHNDYNSEFGRKMSGGERGDASA